MNTTELTYEYLEDLTIFKIVLEGQIDIDRIVATWEYLFRHNLVPINTKRFLFDNRLATYDNFGDITVGLSKIYTKQAAFFKHVRIAIITKTMQGTVQVLKAKREYPHLSHERFQTIDGAIAWLLHHE